MRNEYQVVHGRADSVYNRLVLEYKRPGALRVTNAATPNARALAQAKAYILEIARLEKREDQRLAGAITDGRFLILLRRVGDGWSVDDPVAIGTESVERFLRLLFSLAKGSALIPENLVRDFGPSTSRAQLAVRALHESLQITKNPLAAKLFDQWKKFFSEATDYSEWSRDLHDKVEFRAFVSGMGIKPATTDAEHVFFALHTYYALLIKLVAAMAAAEFTGAPSPLIALATKGGAYLRRALTDIEHGRLFRSYGIRNFLEADFFAWYLSVWGEEIQEAALQLVKRLSEYDPGAVELAPENARDLLKKLYHYLLPREVRHDLGEYYTPDWLAERLIVQTLGSADLGNMDKRVLDPACGSGTFLVILIKHIKERATKNGVAPAKTLGAILRNVVGIDLNPLAVIASRTNYLFALGDLLRSRQGDIEIPVYQADSVLTPSRGSTLFDGHLFSLPTAVGAFRVPAVFADQQRIDALATVLDSSIETSGSAASFCTDVGAAAALDTSELGASRPDLIALHHQLSSLHAAGLDGVWAQIIKNAFAPVFLGPCDYVVGNPPWVNWEHLPDGYREATKPLWEHYGLFPHGGMDAILGKGKKDISMLMTYVAADRYLKPRGKLGFVLSQSIFKSASAAQGFRRFLLPDGTPIGPLVVEDMAELQPFEGATNRTAVAVFVKGYAVHYPVSYQSWRKRNRGRGTSIAFDTPYDEVTRDLITFKPWHARPILDSDPTGPWITARRQALQALKNVIGPSGYRAHAGAYSGGANGVFWFELINERGDASLVRNVVEGAKRKVPTTEQLLETELLFPLLRGRDVGRWWAYPSIHMLMTQDPATRTGFTPEEMASRFPKTLRYLEDHEPLLRSRAAFRRYFKSDDPFWSQFNVSGFTFAVWKVVWREQASQFEAAVVGPVNDRPVVPDHKLMMVEAASEDEADYLCALLNSSPARLVVAAYAINIQIDTHVLENLAVPRFIASNRVHARLASLSNQARRAQARSEMEKLGPIETAIDEAAAEIWHLTPSDVREIQASLET